MRLKNLEVSDPRFETDGLRTVTITSAHLHGRGDLMLYVPPAARRRRSVPLAILLHGVYGSHWGWALRGGAHRTTARLIAARAIPPMVLAMPSDGLVAEGSGYLRHGAGGPDYERWIAQDVPATVAMVERCVDAESPCFIAGLSMGGYGALRLAAKFPERFRAASGHSSATHIDQLRRFLPRGAQKKSWPKADACVLSSLRRRRDRLPPIRFDCGTDDFLLDENRALHRALEQAGIPHRYEEFPGAHDWPYWEGHLEDSLRFFSACLSGRPPAP